MATPLEEILSRLQIKGGSQTGGSTDFASFLPILNSQGVLDPSFFAETILNSVHDVADLTARLALTNLKVGDLVIQADTKTAYTLAAQPPSSEDNWRAVGTTSSNDSTYVAFNPSATTLTSTDVQAALVELWQKSLLTDTAKTSAALITFDTGVAPFVIGSSSTGKLVTGLNADLLDGQQGAFYRNASNLNDGFIPPARLSGTYPISISGQAAVAAVAIAAQSADHATEADKATEADHATAADTATDATNAQQAATLADGQGNYRNAAYLQNAANLNAGILPGERFDDASHGQRAGNDLHSLATPYTHGFISATDQAKLDTILADAEPNQNSFTTFKVGTSTVVPDSKTDTITFASSSPELTITATPAAKTISIGIELGNIVHGDLSGLDADDHTQYLHLSDPRSIVAVHTFNPTITGAPFALGTNARDQLVSYFNADKLHGKTDSFFQNASNLNAGIVPTSCLQGTYNISITGSAGGGLPLTGGILTGLLTLPGLRITGLTNPVAALATDSSGYVVPADPNLFYNAAMVHSTVAGMMSNSNLVTWTYDAGTSKLTANINLDNLTTDLVQEGTINKYTTWTNVQNVLNLGDDLILAAGQLGVKTSSGYAENTILKTDGSGSITLGNLTAQVVTAQEELIAADLFKINSIRNATVQNVANGEEATKLVPNADNQLATKYYVDAMRTNHVHANAVYGLPITEVANQTTRLALTNIKVGEIVYQVDTAKYYILTESPSTWTQPLTLTTSTVQRPGFISAIDRAELLRLASLTESQVAASVFCPTIRLTEPLIGGLGAVNNYTNDQWKKFNTRAVQVRGRSGERYFLLLSFKGWIKKQHKWEITYYSDVNTPVTIPVDNYFDYNQPSRGQNYDIGQEYFYLDTYVPIFVLGQTTITLSVYTFDGKFTSPPASNPADISKVIFPGIPPFSTNKLADPFNGGFVHVEAKGIWAETKDKPFNPYAPDLFMLQVEGEAIGGGLTYYPADPRKDNRLYDGEPIYDAQDKRTALKVNGSLDQSETMKKYQITTADDTDSTLTFEKDHVRCNYTVFNKLSGFNGFLRPSNIVTSGKGLTKKLAKVVNDLTNIPLIGSPKLSADITGSTVTVKNDDGFRDIDITGATNLFELLEKLDDAELISASYNILTDQVLIGDNTPNPDDDTPVPPVYYDSVAWPQSAALRILRVGFGSQNPFEGISLPVASGLRESSKLNEANFAIAVGLMSGNEGEFSVDGSTFTYTAEDTIAAIEAKLALAGYSLKYDAEANEFILKRANVSADLESALPPRAYDIKGNLMMVMGLEKESHGNKDLPLESVHKLLYQEDGIIAAGNFRNYCGSTSAGLAKLRFDGKADPFFNTGIGFDGAIYSIASAKDNSLDIIIAGVDPVSFNGYNRKSVFRINQQGQENTKLSLPYSNLSKDNQERILDVINLTSTGDFAVLTPRKLIVYNSIGTTLKTYEGTKSFHGMVKYYEGVGQTYFLLTSQAYSAPTATQKFNSVGEPLGLRLMVYNHSTHDVTIDPYWATQPLGSGPGAGTGAEASCAYPIVGGRDDDRYVICGNRGTYWGSEVKIDPGNTSWNERGVGNLLLESENFRIGRDTYAVRQATNPKVGIEFKGDWNGAEATTLQIKAVGVDGAPYSWGTWGVDVVNKATQEVITSYPATTFASLAADFTTDWVAAKTGTLPSELQFRFKDLVDGISTLDGLEVWEIDITPPALPTTVTKVTGPTDVNVVVSDTMNDYTADTIGRAATYTVQVTSGGTWGSANVSISSNLTTDQGGEATTTITGVQLDTVYNLGSRGLKFKFTRTLNSTSVLTAGDSWKVAVWPWQEGGLGLSEMFEATDGYGRTYTTITNDTANSSEVGYIYQDFDARTVRMYVGQDPIANNGGVVYQLVAQIKAEPDNGVYPYIGLEFGPQSSFIVGCRLKTDPNSGEFNADLPDHGGASISVVGNKTSNPDFWIVTITAKDTVTANTVVRPIIYPAYTNVFDGGTKVPVSRSITVYGTALQYEPWADTYVRTTTAPIYMATGSTASRFRGLYKIGLEGDLRGKAFPGFATYITHNEPQSHPIPFAVDSKNNIYIGGAISAIQNAAGDIVDVTPWRLYKLDENGKFLQEYNFNDTVTAAIVTPKDKLIVGGRFTCYNKRPVGKIAFLTPEGELLEDITSNEDDIIVSIEEPSVESPYEANKDKLWLDTSVEPPVLNVYDENSTPPAWINALTAARRVSSPVFRTDPPATYTDPAAIFIDVPGYTVLGSGWTAKTDAQVRYKINSDGAYVTYDPENGIVLPEAGSYTIYAEANAPADPERYISRKTYQYFTVREQCKPPQITTVDEGNAIRVRITTAYAQGTLGSKVLYYSYPTGKPPAQVTWLPTNVTDQQTSVEFTTNKNITVKAKAVMANLRDSQVESLDVTIDVGTAVITPKYPVTSTIQYYDRVNLLAGTKGTGILYTIGPGPEGSLEPTIQNYLYNNPGNKIKLIGTDVDIDLMDAAKQVEYFGIATATSTVIKARTVVTEEATPGVYVPVVEQASTVTTTITREAAPTFSPSGFLVKNTEVSSYNIEVIAPADKEIRYDLWTTGQIPDTDVTETDNTATWNAVTSRYDVPVTVTLPTFVDFQLRTRVFNTHTVPSVRVDIPYYWRRPGATVNLLTNPTYGITKFTITPQLDVSAKHLIRYSFDPTTPVTRSSGLPYARDTEVSLETLTEANFIDNILTIQVLEYDTDEDSKYDTTTVVTQARVDVASPNYKLSLAADDTELLEGQNNTIVYDTSDNDPLLSFYAEVANSTVKMLYNNSITAITADLATYNQLFQPAAASSIDFTPAVSDVNSGTLSLRYRAFLPTLIPSRTVALVLRMQLPPIQFDPVHGTNFDGEGFITLTNALKTAVIHYTIDGSTPDTDSNKYAEPIRLRGTATIKAKAVKTGWLEAPEATASYSFNADEWSIALIPDPQYLTQSYPDTFNNEVKWIVDNINKYHIKTAVCLGDNVQTYQSAVLDKIWPEQIGPSYDKLEWIKARIALNQFNAVPGFKWLTLAGNHDLGTDKLVHITYVFENKFHLTVNNPGWDSIGDYQKVKFYGELPPEINQGTYYFTKNVTKIDDDISFQIFSAWPNGPVLNVSDVRASVDEEAALSMTWERPPVPATFDNGTVTIPKDTFTPQSTVGHWLYLSGPSIIPLDPNLAPRRQYYPCQGSVVDNGTSWSFKLANGANNPDYVQFTGTWTAFVDSPDWTFSNLNAGKESAIFNYYFPIGGADGFHVRNGGEEGLYGNWDEKTEWSFTKFVFNKENWLFLTIPYAGGSNTNGMAWIDSILQANSTDHIILFTHSYLDFEETYTPEGTIISAFIAARPEYNWAGVFCGHTHGTSGDGGGYKYMTLSNGKKVFEIRADYQNYLPRNTNGAWVRIVTFKPGVGLISNTTYNTYDGSKYNYVDANQNNFDLSLEQFVGESTGVADVSYGMINIKCGQQLQETPVVDTPGAVTEYMELSLNTEGKITQLGTVPQSTVSALVNSWKGPATFGLSDNDYWNVLKEFQGQTWIAPRDTRGRGNVNETLQVRKYFGVKDAVRYFGDQKSDPTDINRQEVTALENCGLSTESPRKIMMHVRGLNPGKYLLLAYGQKTEFDLDMYNGVCKSKGAGSAFYNYGYPIYNCTKKMENAYAYTTCVYPVRIFRLKGFKKVTYTGNFLNSMLPLVQYVATTFVPYAWYASLSQSAPNFCVQNIKLYDFANHDTLLSSQGTIYQPRTSVGDAFNGYFWQAITPRAASATCNSNAIGVPPYEILGSGVNFPVTSGLEFLILAPAVYADTYETYPGNTDNEIPAGKYYVTSFMQKTGPLEISRCLFDDSSASKCPRQLVTSGTNKGLFEYLFNSVVDYTTGFPTTAWANNTSRWCLGKPV